MISYTAFRSKPDPKVIMPIEIYKEILGKIRSTDLEMTYNFTMERAEDNFVITGIAYPPQWNEPTETKTIDSEYPKWCYDRVKEGLNMRGFGHSHPKFDVKPSGYDINYFNDLVKDTNTFNFRFIMNQNGLIQCDLADKETGWIIQNLPVYVTSDEVTLQITSSTIIPYYPGDIEPFKTTRRSETDESITKVTPKYYYGNDLLGTELEEMPWDKPSKKGKNKNGYKK